MERKITENSMTESTGIRAQAATELLGIYGWAFVLIAVFASLIYVYVSLPSSIAPTSCNFSSEFLCNGVTIATYASNGVTVMAVSVTNMLPYNVQNPQMTVSFDGVNTSFASCTPSVVQSGGSATCVITLPQSTTVGQLVSGSIYMSAVNCGLDPKYLATKSCDAPSQTLSGSFTGHTATAGPVALAGT